MLDLLSKRRLKRRTVRPVRPDLRQELTGFFGFFALMVISDRLSNYLNAPWLAGVVVIFSIIWLACWGGIRAGLAACVLIVGYVWSIYHFHYSIVARFPNRANQQIINAAIFYPICVIFAGVIQNRMRDAAVREFDANETALAESKQRRIAEAELWASEEMRRLIVDSSIDAVIGMTEDGTITLWNPNAQKLFGWTNAEAVGRNITEMLIPERLRPSFQSGLLDQLRSVNGPVRQTLTEQTAQSRSGEEISVEFYVADQKTEKGTIYIAFVRDISERKRAEQAIQELNARLEERVAERTAQLEAANNELVGFTYSVSHDLRAPLRAIVSNSRIVCEEAKDSLDESTYERLKRLEISALKMAELIENLLQFARIGQVPLTYREVDLTAMAEGIAEELKSTKEGSIKVQEGMVVQGDPEMIKMALFNLMENAWKYTRPGENPNVEVGATSQRTFFVRDKGIGFEMQYAHKIWEPFERLHLDSQYPGTGIGLANSKRIIARHGGKVWAESELGEGTTIYFKLATKRSAKDEKERSSYAS